MAWVCVHRLGCGEDLRPGSGCCLTICYWDEGLFAVVEFAAKGVNARNWTKDLGLGIRINKLGCISTYLPAESTAAAMAKQLYLTGAIQLAMAAHQA